MANVNTEQLQNLIKQLQAIVKPANVEDKQVNSTIYFKELSTYIIETLQTFNAEHISLNDLLIFLQKNVFEPLKTQVKDQNFLDQLPDTDLEKMSNLIEAIIQILPAENQKQIKDDVISHLKEQIDAHQHTTRINTAELAQKNSSINTCSEDCDEIECPNMPFKIELRF